MAELFALWLPILATTVVLFVASFVLWTVSPHHKPDWNGAPGEEALLELIREKGIAPGQYMFPYCEDWSDMKDPEKKARHEAGPNGTLNVWHGPPQMGRNMVLQFLFFFVTCVFIAYLTNLIHPPGAQFIGIFRIAGTAGVLAYCFGFIPQAIWFGKPCRSVCTDLFDGVVYGLLTGLLFAMFWPGN